MEQNGDGSMPIYEYRCKECTTDFEDLIRNAADEAALRCPGCGSSDCKKAFSTFATSGGAKRGGESRGDGGSDCGGCTRSSCAGCT